MNMFQALGDINWIAVILATVVYYILGGLWFSPMVFQKYWDRAIGFARPKDWKPDTKFFIGPLLGCLIISIVTAVLLYMLGIQSFTDAAAFGVVVGIGYAASVSFVNAITPTAPKPYLLGAVTAAYHTIGITLVAIIISLFK